MQEGWRRPQERLSYREAPAGANKVQVLRMSSSRRAPENLAMSYYCAAGNQPRMRAIPADISENKITLRLVDTSNLKSPGDSQIIGLVVRFEDTDHFAQEWTSRENGKVQTTIFRWTRKK